MKIIRKVMLACLMGLFFLYRKSIPVHGAQPVVVAIDPGHGGENLGKQKKGHSPVYPRGRKSGLKTGYFHALGNVVEWQ